MKAIKERNPQVKVAVAGCIAQQKGETLFEKFPYIDFIFGPQNIHSLQKWINPAPFGTGQSTEYRTQITALQENPEHHTEILPVKREGGVRAWVSIMYGCDNFCAYCVVPYTRGRERSRAVSDISREVRELSEYGYKEITLLGQNVNSYGKNLSESIDFPDLLKAIHEIEGIQRIRFVTSHPRGLSEKLIEKIRDLPKVCEHIHLPIQAGSDRILDLMNRGYTYAQYKEKIDMLKKEIPDIAITTDIIVGFPGEKEDDFDCTVKALKEIEFDGIFAFKYSKRPDTKAIGLPGHIDEKIKSERLAAVLILQENITYKKNKLLEGKILDVLVEGQSETDSDKLTGRTRTNKIVNFYPVRKKNSNGVYGDNKLIGNLVNIKIFEARQHSLFGELHSE